MHTMTASTLDLHRTAVLATIGLVDGVGPGDMPKATPCTGWDLADLLTHMTVQHRGFAAAARGHGADAGVWDPAIVADGVTADPARAYAAAAHDVLDAFAADGVLEVPFALPEFGPGATFPGSIATGFHFVDYVVHGWDVARSLGAAFRLPDDVVAAAVPFALAVPDGDIRTVEGSPFGLAVPATGPLDDMDRILTHLGRSPK